MTIPCYKEVISVFRMLLRRKWFLISLSLLATFLIILLFPSWTPQIKDEDGNVLPNSIATLERVELGGIEQSILIRGADQDQPILLLLHGGPGYPQIGFARHNQQQLETEFIVVNWDQRGSGKSYHWNMTDEDLHIDRLIEDTYELTQYLRKKFNQEKIFIVGHSWGSLLGIWTVQKYPELYHAYIGIGQVANLPEGERVSYEFALREAYERSNEQAIKELESIGYPPYKNPRKDTTLERKWVTAFGGSERNINSNSDLMRGILFSPEYTWLDGVRLALGNSLSLRAIMPQTENMNLFETVPELKVSVYFIMGKHDYMTPSEVAYHYYEQLNAPNKQFIWFEESAHFPHFEEVDRFFEVMVGVKGEVISGQQF